MLTSIGLKLWYKIKIFINWLSERLLCASMRYLPLLGPVWAGVEPNLSL